MEGRKKARKGALQKQQEGKRGAFNLRNKRHPQDISDEDLYRRSMDDRKGQATDNRKERTEKNTRTSPGFSRQSDSNQKTEKKTPGEQTVINCRDKKRNGGLSFVIVTARGGGTIFENRGVARARDVEKKAEGPKGKKNIPISPKTDCRNGTILISAIMSGGGQERSRKKKQDNRAGTMEGREGYSEKVEKHGGREEILV